VSSRHLVRQREIVAGATDLTKRFRPAFAFFQYTRRNAALSWSVSSNGGAESVYSTRHAGFLANCGRGDSSKDGGVRRPAAGAALPPRQPCRGFPRSFRRPRCGPPRSVVRDRILRNSGGLLWPLRLIPIAGPD
jgi:hypothetical protein